MSMIREELRDFIVNNYLFDQDFRLRDTDSFIELGIIDSMGVLELVSHLEEKYAIKIGTDELVPENLDCIEKAVNFVERKLADERGTQVTADRGLSSRGAV